MMVSEAVSLPAGVARTEVSHLLIRGKGDKERIVPLHERAQKAILRWQSLAGEYGASFDTWLFHSVRDGKKHLSTRAAELEINDTAVAAGLSRTDLITPRVLRNAFAAHMLVSGTDLRVLQSFLGHAFLGTTEIYAHIEGFDDAGDNSSQIPIAASRLLTGG
jgi:integrase/recombinase XerD